MDFHSKLSSALKEALNIANSVSAELGASYIGSEHIIHAFLKMERCVAYRILTEAGVTPSKYEQVFFRTINKQSNIEGMTDRTQQMFQSAMRLAAERGCLPGSAHMLTAILASDTCFAVKILRQFGVDVEKLKIRAAEEMSVCSAVYNAYEYGSGIAGNGATGSGGMRFGFGESGGASRGGTPYGANATGKVVEERPTGVKKETSYEKPSSRSKILQKLSAYGMDMTERAKKGKLDPVIGRQKEIEKVVQVLSRRSKNNPVLIGEPGVGKSAIAEGLAQLIVSGEVPEQLYNKTVFSVDVPGMLAGAKYRGEFEERLKELVDTVLEDGDIVLFIDEIHTIVGAGASEGSSMDAANILKPMLARGDLQVIGATTIEEYRKYIEKDGALERRFTPVFVEEPSEADAIAILKGLRRKYEQHHGIVISDEAIEAAVKLSSRYITDRFLPDKAIDLIDEAASHARIVTSGGFYGKAAEVKTLEDEIERREAEASRYERLGDFRTADGIKKEISSMKEKVATLERAQALNRLPDGRHELGKEQVAAIVSARVKIPLLKITQEEGERLMRLEEDLHKRIVGQNEAVSAVAKAIRRARAGLKDASRPIGSFIFVGPTGVGKTDLCKALAEAMFGSEEQMIRLDMSEYMEKQSVSKIIGAPPGYAGYDDSPSGQLTDKIRTNPYSLVLFDEIEKAHGDVFNLLLQILDDGRLTDNKGKTANFKNAIIILTSNIGAAETASEKTGVYGFGGSGFGGAQADVEKEYDSMKERIKKALKERFRPEFLNRMDDIIVFHALSEADCAKIAGKMIEGLAKRLQEQRGICLNVTEAAKAALVKEGYDPHYGARPLKRVIQRRIEDKLSEEILTGRICNGQRITVDFSMGEFCVLAD